MRSGIIFFAVLSVFLFSTPFVSAQIREINARDTGHHGYFTDLTPFESSLIGVFRTGASHVSGDGQIAIIRLVEGSDWEWDRVGTIAVPHADLRDPKITRMSNGELLLIATAVFPKVSEHIQRQTLGWLSDDGFLWQPIDKVADHDLWLWSLHTNQYGVYGVSYSAGKMAAAPNRRTLRLHQFNGRRFEVVTEFSRQSSELDHGFHPSEVALTTLQNGKMVTVIRRGKPKGKGAVLGEASYPYTSWNFYELPVPIEGPSLLTLSNGKIICAGRRTDVHRMSVMELLVPQRNVRTFATLSPAGQDFAYPGLAWYNEHLVITYYSDGKIYFTGMKQGVPSD